MIKKRPVIYIPAALITLVAVWGITCFNPFLLWFQNDDFSHILLSSRGVMFQHNFFRPVCDLSVIMDYRVWGHYAEGYHITNLVLHIACTAVMYFFTRRVFAQHFAAVNKPVYPVLAAVLFFVCPFHAEAVFWILGRSGILGAIFSLMFLAFFLKQRPGMANTATSIAAYIAALLTYESSWVLPLIAFVLQRRPPGKPFYATIRRYYILAVVFVVYLGIRYAVIRQVLEEYDGTNFIHFNAVTLGLNFFRLASMSFISWSGAGKLWQVLFLAGLVLPVYALVAGPTSKPAGKLLACFCISLLPYLSLGIDTHGSEGERFLYLPSAFAVLLITAGTAGIKRPVIKYITAGYTGILYAVFLYVTAVNYRFAGSVVKQTIAQVNLAPGNATITVEGLPESQYGALIFGSGLEDAVTMYQPKRSMHILSWRDRLMPLHQPYKTIELPLEGDGSNIKYVFTDSALVVYKPATAR